MANSSPSERGILYGCLLLLLPLLPLLSFAQQPEHTGRPEITEFSEISEESESSEVSEDSEISRRGFSLSTPKASLTGLLITREEDGRISGSIINEFGISAMDFRFDMNTRKVKLLSVAAFLDKWYIRMMLRKDLSVIMTKMLYPASGLPKGYSSSEYDGGLTITNIKRNVTYKFSLL